MEMAQDQTGNERELVNESERPSPEQSIEAFRVWQEGGKEALGEFLLEAQRKHKEKTRGEVEP